MEQTVLKNEAHRKNEVHAQSSAFPTVSAIAPDYLFAGLLPLDHVSTVSQHITDSVSL